MILTFLALSLAQFPIPSADAGVPTDGGEAPWNVSNPPGPGHDVSIDVTEGTWLNLDVHPNGKQLVFDLLGDLYTLPIEGGEAKPLTNGLAWDMQPRYSPDGRFLAFTSDRGGGDNLWVLDTRADGGTPTPVSSEKHRLVTSPTWSPDSQSLVGRKHFSSRRSLGAGELWLYHRSGGEGVQLTEKPTDQKDVGEPAFSPDGRYIYFSQDVTPGKSFEYNKDPNGEIYAVMRLDLEKRELDKVLGGAGSAIRPTPSPDGKSIAFIRRVRAKSVLFVADLKSGRELALFDGLDRDLMETWAIHGVYPTMAWLPDSASIVFWAQGGIWRLNVATKKATRIPFHVKTSRRVAEAVRFPQVVAPPQLDVKMTRWVQASPKGDRVVFEALGRLWVKGLPNGAAKRLTAQNDHAEGWPSFTADGQSIVYSTWNDETLSTIRVVSAAGGEGKVLTALPGHYVAPVISPDGKMLVYQSVGGGQLVSALYAQERGLYVQPVSGGTPRRLSKDGADPHFAGRSDRVFFMTVAQDGKEDVRALKSMGLDASEERTHLTSDEASEYRVSPDGKWLAFRENFHVFLMPFPKGAKAAVASPEGKALPVAKLTRDAGEAIHFSGDSKSLHWSLGPTLFTRELKDAFKFIEGAPVALPSPPVTGVDLKVPAVTDFAKGDVALIGARIITMKGDQVIDDGTVLVHDGRIAAVGPRSSVTVPKGAKAIDVAGKTIIPGLVDVHWHGAVGEAGFVPQQNYQLLASLAFGVTTIHDPSNDTDSFFAAAEQQRTGLIVGPRLFSTGTILYGAQGWFRASIETLEDARTHLRRLKAVGAFSVKSYNQPRRDQRQKVIAAARELQMMVVPEGGSLLQHNLTQIIDGHTGIEHAVPVAKIYEDVLQLWAGTRVGYTPTLGVAYGGLMGENYWYMATDVWKDERLSSFVPRKFLDARSRRRVKVPDEELNHISAARVATQLQSRGVEVQLGAHGQREGLAAHWELAMFAQGGMSALNALRAGTIDGAKYLGLDRDVGSLEVGKLADLVVLDANPLEKIAATQAVRFTMLGGRLYQAATLDELWPRQRKRAPLYFERSGEDVWPDRAASQQCGGH